MQNNSQDGPKIKILCFQSRVKKFDDELMEIK
jgi:hypothetical protein